MINGVARAAQALALRVTPVINISIFQSSIFN
jgi:hypothetical protein